MKPIITPTTVKVALSLLIYLLALIVITVVYNTTLTFVFLMIIIANRLERVLVIDQATKQLQSKLANITKQLNEIKNKPNYCYYMISHKAYSIIKPTIVSKPIPHTYGQPVYTTILSDTDFEIIQQMYSQLSKEDQQHFWIEQIVPGQVNIKDFNLNAIKIGNLFDEIENQLSITKLNNIAMTIFAICDKLKISPIQLFNNQFEFELPKDRS